MRASFGSLSVVPWILFAQMTWPSARGPIITPGQPEVYVASAIHDHAGLFGDAARRRAHAALRRVQRDRGVPVVVETFGSLRGGAIDDVARHRPRPLGDGGIHVVIAGIERDVAVRVVRDGRHRGPPAPDRAAIRQAFLRPLRAGNADEALEQGVRAIEAAVACRSGSGPGPGRILPATILVGILAVLFAIRDRASPRGGRRGRRSHDAEAVHDAEGRPMPAPARFGTV